MKNSIDSSPESERVRTRLKSRLWRTVDYLSIYIFVLVVYGSAVGFDYLMFRWLWALLSEEVHIYPFVEQALNYTRIGLAVLFILTGVIHAVISSISQVKLDLQLAKESGG